MVYCPLSALSQSALYARSQDWLVLRFLFACVAKLEQVRPLDYDCLIISSFALAVPGRLCMCCWSIGLTCPFNACINHQPSARDCEFGWLIACLPFLIQVVDPSLHCFGSARAVVHVLLVDRSNLSFQCMY